MRAFDDLVRAGKVLYVGISDAPAWVVAKSNMQAELRGWTRYVGLQIEYSLLERTVERELVPMAQDQQMTVLAWGPLSKGVLTGKYLPENVKQSEAEGARMHSPMMKAFGSVAETTHATVREIVLVGKELGVSAAQVALAWLHYRPVSVIPIIGARKLDQIEDNIRSLDVKISPEQVQRLDKTSAVPLGFPHNYLAMDSMRAMIYGGIRDRIRA
jgi:aryl-alcohol dehydrogenase-like predicted oxidoreductase